MIIIQFWIYLVERYQSDYYGYFKMIPIYHLDTVVICIWKDILALYIFMYFLIHWLIKIFFMGHLFPGIFQIKLLSLKLPIKDIFKVRHGNCNF